MGACIARCWPLIADPRYHPVRGRYLIQDDTVQVQQPRRHSSLAASSDESLCLTEDLLPCGQPSGTVSQQEADGEEDDPLLSLTPPAECVSSERTYTQPLLSPSPPLLTASPPSPLLLTASPPSPPLLTWSPPSPPLLTGSPPSPPLLTGSPPNPPLLTGSPPSPPLLTGSPPIPPLLTGSPPSPPLLTGSPPSPPLLTGSPPNPPLLTGSPPNPPLLTGSPPNPPLLTWSPPSTSLPADSAPSTPLPASPPHSPLAGLFPSQAHYYNLTPQAEDEVELTPHLEQQDTSDPPTTRPFVRVASQSGGEQRWLGIHGVPGSLPSLAEEPDSPPTTSIDLEWEPEAGLVRNSLDPLAGDEEASQTAESGSWVQRSSSSTPNSLEWDFRASTLSLRGGLEDETWQHTDMETEQLLQEIEQLAARALADTGHGLQPPPR